MNFFRFFSNLRNFFFVLKKGSEVTKFGYSFAKPYDLLKNDSQFARGFQKLEKMFGQIDNSILAKKKLGYRFFVAQFLFLLIS